LAGWYEESRYTFRRITYASKNITEEAGLDKMDLIGSYDVIDISIFQKE
jgi:hypothetical protein